MRRRVISILMVLVMLLTMLPTTAVAAMFEEEDKIVILDYKTDAVNDMYELDMRYRKQLELYSQAVSASLGKEVKELVIYSTKFGKELML